MIQDAVGDIFFNPNSLQWRQNERDGVSNHKPHYYLLKRLFRHRWNKTSKLRVTGLCAGNSPVTGEFPNKEPVTRKMFPFDDGIMFNEADKGNAWQLRTCMRITAYVGVIC